MIMMMIMLMYFFQERKIEINKMKTLLSQVSSKQRGKETKFHNFYLVQVISKPLTASGDNNQADEE